MVPALAMRPVAHTGAMAISLRAQEPHDLGLLTGGDSPFDDFGPTAVRATPLPPKLDEAGALSVIAEDGEVCGYVSWHWRQWGPTAGSRCPMIGIWLRPDRRGRRIGRTAQALLVDLFFAHTTTNRVEAHTDIDNVPEQRALEAAGFVREGQIRGAQWRAGGYRDGFLYAVLRHDPRPGTAQS